MSNDNQQFVYHGGHIPPSWPIWQEPGRLLSLLSPVSALTWSVHCLMCDHWETRETPPYFTSGTCTVNIEALGQSSKPAVQQRVLSPESSQHKACAGRLVKDAVYRTDCECRKYWKLWKQPHNGPVRAIESALKDVLDRSTGYQGIAEAVYQEPGDWAYMASVLLDQSISRVR